MGSLFNLDSPIMRTLSKIADLIILNLLFLVCSVPIFTLGASMAALYSVTLKMVKNEDSYIFRGFLKAFKENFKQSTIIWLIMLLLGAILYYDFQFAQVLPTSIAQIIRIIIIMITTFYVLTFLYIFPYLARFFNTVKATFKNSILISILNLPFSFLIALITVGAGVLTFLSSATFVYGIMLWILIGFALIAYINSFLFRHIFAKYEGGDDENKSDLINPS